MIFLKFMLDILLPSCYTIKAESSRRAYSAK
uniref:Uncharacterized protein n=1 Tax=Siphoviridae sp. ctDDY10 TaxID=2827810 RepID=A0A8S5TID9_9CAUD|nr:MAG TPA: hypothetical protein [Siphoviridae sp. ctDDY10]